MLLVITVLVIGQVESNIFFGSWGIQSNRVGCFIIDNWVASINAVDSIDESSFGISWTVVIAGTHQALAHVEYDLKSVETLF